MKTPSLESIVLSIHNSHVTVQEGMDAIIKWREDYNQFMLQVENGDWAPTTDPTLNQE